MPFYEPKFTRDPKRIDILKANYEAGAAFEKRPDDERRRMDIEAGECDFGHLMRLRAAAGLPEPKMH